MWLRARPSHEDLLCRTHLVCTTANCGCSIPDEVRWCAWILRTGQADVVARFPGYTRGLAIQGNLAFVGLSRIRETSTFGGVPIAEQRDRLKCGVGIVDIQRGELVGQFEFKSGVEEIFDVKVLAETHMAALRGPFAKDDGDPTVWVVPEPTSPPYP